MLGGSGPHGQIDVFTSEGKNLASIGAVSRGRNDDIDDIRGYMTVSNKHHVAVHISTAIEGNGGSISIFNKTGEKIISMSPDEYGNGVIGAYSRKGNKGRTLESR